MVASAPASAAAAAAVRASLAEAPSATALSRASTAGASASTIVLSPSWAAPSLRTAASAAPSAPASPARSTSGASASAWPARRNAVPYSGPEAPPTFEIRVVPVSASTVAGVRGEETSKVRITAAKPRDRFVPWSPSPIAASSALRCSRSVSTAPAARVIQARTKSASKRALEPWGGFIGSPAPAQGGRFHRRVPEFDELIRQAADGQREALHLEAGDVVADQAAGDPSAACLELLADLVEDDVELDQRRAAHAVGHHEQVPGHVHVLGDGLDRGRDEL